MDHLGTILPIVLTLTTLAATAFGGSMRTNLQNLRESTSDLRNRVADLKAERDEAVTEAALHKSDLDALGRMVRNEAELNALAHQIQENHQETKVFWQVQTDLGKQTLEAIERLSGGQ